MSTTSQQILTDIEALLQEMQQGVLYFIQFLKHEKHQYNDMPEAVIGQAKM